MQKMKWVPLLIAAAVSTAVNAKTTTYSCETKPLSIPGTTRGPGNQIKAQDNSVTTWNVVLETDQSGSVSGVTSNNETKKFTQKGDLVTFQAAVFSSLEIDTQTKQARITITGYDTAEQGVCKVLSVTGAPATSSTLAPATTTTANGMVLPAAWAATAVAATPVQAVNKELKAMVVSEVQVTDSDKYKEYVSKVQASLPAFGGILIVKGENSSALDGSKSGGSIAIVQFPNRTKAMQWYVSDEYQKILKSTSAVTSTRVYNAD